MGRWVGNKWGKLMGDEGYLVRLFVQTHLGPIPDSGAKGCSLPGRAEGDTCPRVVYGLLLGRGEG